MWKRPQQVLLDVYETVLTCDFDRHFHGLADAAGVDFANWSSALGEFVPALVRGHVSIAEAFRRVLNSCGAQPSGAPLIAVRDVELIIECSTVFSDVLPSIRLWRSHGVKVALVSNCVANTRPLLEALGLLDAVDAAILSCEVNSVKPEPEIYVRAADVLGVTPQRALFVDDQIQFCHGAESVGMRSVLIDRTRLASAPAGLLQSVASLTEFESKWSA